MVFLNIKGDLFSLYIKCMRVLGIWPMDKPCSSIIFRANTSIQILLLITLLIIHVGKCPENKLGSVDFLITVWHGFAITLQLSCRLCRSQKNSLIKSTIHDWLTVTDPIERGIMIEHDKRGSLIFTFRAALVVISAVHLIFQMPFFNVLTIRDLEDTCVFADNSTWGTVHVSLGLIVAVLTDIMDWSNRALFWTFFMHLSAQYKILKVRYDNLHLIHNNKKRRRVFRRLVLRHNELFIRSGNLETSFNYCCMVFVFFDQLRAGVDAVVLVANIKTISLDNGAQTLTWIMLHLLGLSIFYYASDYLSTCCEDVGEAFTQCNWYELPKEFIVNYSIAISRCQRPTQCAIMKIYKLNLYNFKYVLQALYSYVSIMLAVTKDAK